MENKLFSMNKAIFLFLLLLFSSFVFAEKQKITKDETFSANLEESILEEETELSAQEMWQYLEWEEENPEYVLHYEVVIESFSEEAGSFEEIRRIMTEDNSSKVQINPLLAPGVYRYKVISYNLVDVPEVESSWFEFKIYKAYQPEILDIKSAANRSATLFLEEINDGVFNISGKNLFALPQNESDISFTEYALLNSKKKNGEPIIPEILENEKNRRLKVLFDMKKLDVGKYNFVATDASGLKSGVDRKSEIEIKFKKRVDFDLSAGYVFPVVLYDGTFEKYLDTNLLPLSATARASFVPFKHRFGYFGFGIFGSYSRIFADYSNYQIDGNLINADALFLYQLPVRVKSKKSEKRRHILTLEVHGGAGISFFNDLKFHFEHDIVSEPLNSINLNAVFGGAVQFYITNRLYSEFSFDCVLAFLSDMDFGMILPSVSIGWQF